MKNKISLDSYLNNISVKETSLDIIKKINGGCTFRVGRCLADGTGYIDTIYSSCSNYSTHRTKAINYAAQNLARGTTRKIKVGSTITVL